MKIDGFEYWRKLIFIKGEVAISGWNDYLLGYLLCSLFMCYWEKVIFWSNDLNNKIVSV